MRQRSRLPDRIANAPKLFFGLELYYDAFWELNTCRSAGWGVMPIPWSSIRDYSVTFDLDEAQEEDLFYLIRVMDNAFLDYHEGKKPSPPAGTGSSSQGAWS